ncbi:hypothetical protein L1987_31421 [Smallanthus sonchifolius]|uniref:Uncharacterized protein n=1 Tax=Smallanthus sonchifolius TaxID=185202 RepID=A0ACB9I695_9ASTR|nr:hypothetical protein L1987_31421 [Smallanthus sonchifolius]
MDVHGIKKATSSSFWGMQVKDLTKVNATRVGAIARNMLLPTIRTIALKPMMVINQKKMISDLDLGRMVNDGLVFRQNVYIRSYEVGPEQTTSIETIMNHLQSVRASPSKLLGSAQHIMDTAKVLNTAAVKFLLVPAELVSRLL